MLMAVATDARRGAQPDESARRKARYYYMQGVVAQAGGDNASAYEMYKRAYLCDTSYLEAASAYASERMSIETDSMQSEQALRDGLRLMRGFVDAYPADFFEAEYYAYIAAHIDTLEEAIRIYKRSDALFPEKTGSLIRLAESQMAAGQLDSAVATLERYERAEGPSVPLSMQKISYIMSSRDTLRSIQVATDLVATNPRNAEFLMFKGTVMRFFNMRDSAFTYYSAAEQAAPDNGRVKLSLADWYKEAGDTVNYDTKVYEALLSEDFDLKQKHEVLATYLQNLIHDKSDTSRGDHLFSVLRDQYPHEPVVLDLAARYDAAKGDFSGAAEEIGYAIDLNPTEERYRTQLMTYLIQLDKYKEALDCYDASKSYLSNVSPAMTQIAAAAASMNKDYRRVISLMDEEIRKVDHIIAESDTLPPMKYLATFDYDRLALISDLLTSKADAYFSLGDTVKSFLMYENAIRLLPDNALALNNYAYFLATSGGDLDKALELSDKALKAAPDNETYLDTYAWILFLKGRYEEARTYQAAAIEKTEKDGTPSAELYSHYGDILFMNRMVDEALDYWKKALELEPDNELLQRKVKHKTFFFK